MGAREGTTDAKKANGHAHARALAAPDLALVAFSVVTAASGQALLRVGAAGLSGGPIRVVVAAFTSPAVLGGLCLYVASSVVWMVVLSRTPLSVAYPLGSSGYVLVALAGWAMGEALPPMRVAGLALIVVGIVLVGTGGRR